MGEAKRRGTYEQRLSMAKELKKTTSATADLQGNTTQLKKPGRRVVLSGNKLAMMTAILVGLGGANLK